MEPLLRIADELERQDARAAAALREVEELQREVEETRVHASAAAAFLAELPGLLEERGREARAAAESRVEAERRLDEAEAVLARAEERDAEEERLAAERAVRQARDALREADLWRTRAGEERERLERAGEARRAEAESLERRAHELAGRLAAMPRVARESAVPPAAEGLDAVLDWAARARGGLLVARAGIVTEQDKAVREASELLASVSGEPLTSTRVAGVRDRVARALGQ